MCLCEVEGYKVVMFLLKGVLKVSAYSASVQNEVFRLCVDDGICVKRG